MRLYTHYTHTPAELFSPTAINSLPSESARSYTRGHRGGRRSAQRPPREREMRYEIEWRDESRARAELLKLLLPRSSLSQHVEINDSVGLPGDTYTHRPPRRVIHIHRRRQAYPIEQRVHMQQRRRLIERTGGRETTGESGRFPVYKRDDVSGETTMYTSAVCAHCKYIHQACDSRLTVSVL